MGRRLDGDHELSGADDDDSRPFRGKDGEVFVSEIWRGARSRNPEKWFGAGDAWGGIGGDEAGVAM